MCQKTKIFVLAKTFGFPDAAAADSAAAADGRTLRSQPDPSPNAPRDQIRRKGPCCDCDLMRSLDLPWCPRRELQTWNIRIICRVVRLLGIWYVVLVDFYVYVSLGIMSGVEIVLRRMGSSK